MEVSGASFIKSLVPPPTLGGCAERLKVTGRQTGEPPRAERGLDLAAAEGGPAPASGAPQAGRSPRRASHSPAEGESAYLSASV